MCAPVWLQGNFSAADSNLNYYIVVTAPHKKYIFTKIYVAEMKNMWYNVKVTPHKVVRCALCGAALSGYFYPITQKGRFNHGIYFFR